MEIAQIESKQQVARIQDNQVDLEIVATVCNKTGFKTGHLESIVKNKNRAIRNFPPGETTNAFLLNEIKKISLAFGNGEVQALALGECIKALKEQFKGVSIPEVWIAFRLHAAGDLPNLEKGEMYGGKMTAKSFIAVMASWVQYKAESVAAYWKEVAEQEEARKDAERAEMMKADFGKKVADQITRLREKNSDWRDCPVYLFDTLRRNGFLPELDSKEVWWPIWEDSLALAQIEQAEQNHYNHTERGMIRLIGDIAKKANEEGIAEKRKTIAKKIAIFRLVINNSEFNLDIVTKQLSL